MRGGTLSEKPAETEENMFHIGMTQWIVGDEPLAVSCERLKRCGYNGIEFAAEPYRMDAGECRSLLEKYGLDCRSLCGIFDESRDLTADGEAGERAVQYIRDSVDFVKVAEAYGAIGIRVQHEDEIEPAIIKAIEAKSPVFIDFVVENFEMVYPWVLAGEPLTKVLLSNDCAVK